MVVVVVLSGDTPRCQREPMVVVVVLSEDTPRCQREPMVVVVVLSGDTSLPEGTNGRGGCTQ